MIEATQPSEIAWQESAMLDALRGAQLTAEQELREVTLERDGALKVAQCRTDELYRVLCAENATLQLELKALKDQIESRRLQWRAKCDERANAIGLMVQRLLEKWSQLNRTFKEMEGFFTGNSFLASLALREAEKDVKEPFRLYQGPRGGTFDVLHYLATYNQLQAEANKALERAELRFAEGILYKAYGHYFGKGVDTLSEVLSKRLRAFPSVSSLEARSLTPLPPPVKREESRGQLALATALSEPKAVIAALDSSIERELNPWVEANRQLRTELVRLYSSMDSIESEQVASMSRWKLGLWIAVNGLFSRGTIESLRLPNFDGNEFEYLGMGIQVFEKIRKDYSTATYGKKVVELIDGLSLISKLGEIVDLVNELRQAIEPSTPIFKE